MIRYLSKDERDSTRFLYEECFPEDDNKFVDYYYRWKIRDNEILVLEEEKQIQAMLHLNPFGFKMCGENVTINYVVAVATGECFRGQRKMTNLMRTALEDMAKRHMPFTFLIPAVFPLFV